MDAHPEHRHVEPARFERTGRLSATQRHAVHLLVDEASAVDGSPALNERARLALAEPGTRIFAYAEGLLAGYAQLDDELGTAQIVVRPSLRRRGIGERLLAEVQANGVTHVWAFGDTPDAQRLAARAGLTAVRELLVMERPLDEPLDAQRPAGVRLAAFQPGLDEDALLAVNAAAFAHHPEQGGMDRAELAERMAEPWFDPAGLLLAWTDEPEEVLAGFHWTKRHDAAVHDAGLGEVYVLAVHPERSGAGIGRFLLAAGLEHLRRTGCTRVLLYVEADQTRVVQMYTRASFEVTHRDVLYARDGEAPAAAGVSEES